MMRRLKWSAKVYSSTFHDAVSFLNLHGDARNFRQQTQFLCDISMMHFVLLNINELDESGCEMLQALSKAPGGVILLHNGRVYRSQRVKGINIKRIVELDKKNEADSL